MTLGVQNPNDQIRSEILDCLYQIHQKSRSPKSASIKISELNRLMKIKHGYKQNQISTNLDYLVQEGFAVEQHKPRTFKTKQGAEYSSEEITYKISSAGINRIEKASLYKAPSTGGTVNIGNVHGVLIMGDGNVVNSTYTEAAAALSDLRKQVSDDVQLSSGDKISALSDLDSLTTQMQKPSPNIEVMKMLWTSAKSFATVNGAVTLVQHLDHLFHGLGW